MSFQTSRRASRARLALSLTALIWARQHVVARAQVLVSGPATKAVRTLAVETPAPPVLSALASSPSSSAATTLEVATPTPTDTPPVTEPPPSETTAPPSESQDENADAPVPPSTAPPESLSPAAEQGQTRLRAQFRVSGAGASAETLSSSEETRGAFLDALAAGSSKPPLPRSSLTIVRVTPAYVSLPASSSSKKKMLRKSRRQLLILDPISDTSDVLVEVDASFLNRGSASADAQAAYDSVRNAAYSGLIQTSLRGTGRRWAVVLTYAASARPGDDFLLPAPDDACENRFSKSSCLDGTGLTPAAAKGIIAVGVLVVLFALAFAGVAWDRRARAVGFGGAGSGNGSGNGNGNVRKTGTMADLAGSPRAAASAAGLTAIPPPPAQAQQSAIGEASGSAGPVAGKIKAER